MTIVEKFKMDKLAIIVDGHHSIQNILY